MNRLDKISNSLSWAECLPGISVVPAIIHLICVVRDRIFTPQPFIPPNNETFRQFSQRKLNDWTHLRKGVLALIPIIGNAILFINWSERTSALDNISKLNTNTLLVITNRVPVSLVNDPDFLERLPQNNRHTNDALFSRTLLANKNNRTLVMNLINRDIITANSYAQLSNTLQNNPDILNAYAEQIKRFSQRLVNSQNAVSFFGNLDQKLRDHPDIANAFAEPLEFSRDIAQITALIGNQNTLVSSPALASGALFSGRILFKNLPENLQKTPEMAIGALNHDFTQWPFIPKTIREDKGVIAAFRNKKEAECIRLLLSGDIAFKDITDKDLQTKNMALAALRRDLNQWNDMSDALKSDPILIDFYNLSLRNSIRRN